MNTTIFFDCGFFPLEIPNALGMSAERMYCRPTKSRSNMLAYSTLGDRVCVYCSRLVHAEIPDGAALVLCGSCHVKRRVRETLVQMRPDLNIWFLDIPAVHDERAAERLAAQYALMAKWLENLIAKECSLSLDSNNPDSTDTNMAKDIRYTSKPTVAVVATGWQEHSFKEVREEAWPRDIRVIPVAACTASVRSLQIGSGRDYFTNLARHSLSTVICPRRRDSITSALNDLPEPPDAVIAYLTRDCEYGDLLRREIVNWCKIRRILLLELDEPSLKDERPWKLQNLFSLIG